MARFTASRRDHPRHSAALAAPQAASTSVAAARADTGPSAHADDAAVPTSARADVDWYDASWDLKRGLEVAELGELPPDWDGPLPA